VRIPLVVDKLFVDRKAAYATFFIRIQAMRVARTAVGVVDTGSPYTTISPRDAFTFNLPISNWQKGETVSLAGFVFYRHPLDAILSFKDADRKLVHFKTNVAVLVPTKIDSQTISKMKDIPSLIGTDFMEDQSLSLFFDVHSDTAYFERPDTVAATPSA